MPDDLTCDDGGPNLARARPRLARALATLLGAVLALCGCDVVAQGPLRVVVIGENQRILDPTRRTIAPADAVLLGAAAEGLVRLDAGGQIVPGLAERWNVSDDGLSYIFRLGIRTWPDGGRVTARFVVRQLRAAADPANRNPLSSVLTGIEEIVATNDVIEIRLRAPRPNLLYHLAAPELAIVREDAGAGPFRIERDEHAHLLLSRMVPAGEEEVRETVLLETARPALAVALFMEGGADLVLGGTSSSLPVLRAADPPAAALRFDPANGLFGLAVVDAKGPLQRLELRQALSMAVDREAIVSAMAVRGLQPRATLTPAGLSNLPRPAPPAWLAATLAQRRAEARRLVGNFGLAPIRVRVAMPNAPGDRLLFAHLKRDWAMIGVEASRVDMPRSADLRLVDAVAPSRGASWYLERFACARAPVCDAAADIALQASRTAANAPERAASFAEADRRLTDAAVFIPISAPIRWSLVSRRVTGYRANPFAVHSLTDLRGERR